MKRTRKCDRSLKQSLLSQGEYSSDADGSVTGEKVATARKGALKVIRKKVEDLVDLVGRTTQSRSVEEGPAALEPKKVRLISEPELRAPLNSRDLLHDLGREVSKIEQEPLVGYRKDALEALWSGVAHRLQLALAPDNSSETDAQRALAVILLANQHVSFERFAYKGNAEAFSKLLTSLRKDMRTSSPEPFWQGAELGTVLQGLLRISMHAGIKEDIARHAQEMLKALCGNGRVSDELATAMAGLVEAAHLACFNVEGLWQRSSALVRRVVDELLKIGPPAA